MDRPVLGDNPSLPELQAYAKAMFVYRNFDAGVKDEFIMLAEEVGELGKALRKHNGIRLANDAADLNIQHEAADVLWALMTICNLLDIDLEDAFRSKEEKNKNRTWS